MRQKNIAYLILGGNLGNRKENLASAITYIQRLGQIIAFSGIYETAAWGRENLPSYYNQVLALQTSLSAEKLLEQLLLIEQKLGRVRKEKYDARTMDIDILLYNTDVIDKEYLKIPHPLMAERRFVLVPLCEIAAGYTHPIYQKTIQFLLENCVDKLEVKQIK